MADKVTILKMKMFMTHNHLTLEIQTGLIPHIINPKSNGVKIKTTNLMLDSSIQSYKEMTGLNVDGTLMMRAFLSSGEFQWLPKCKSVTLLKLLCMLKVPTSFLVSLLNGLTA